MTRQIIFLLMAIVMILPFVAPLTIGRFDPAPSTRQYYERIEQLPAGSTVLVSFDFDPSSKPELEPTAYATMEHLFRKNIKAVCMSLWSTAPVIATEILSNVSKKMGKEYGKDWCYLGYRDGRHSVINSMGINIYTLFSEDFSRNKTSELPIMKGINTLKDFPLIIDFEAGDPGIETWIQFCVDKFNIDLIGACTAVIEPSRSQFLQSKQLKGLVAAMRGAGEYEGLVGVKGKGTRAMNAIQLGQLLVVVLIILGNFKRKKK